MRWKIGLVAACIGVSPSASFATATTFTNEAAFDAATKGQNYGFDAYAPASGYSYYGSKTLTVGPAQFLAPAGSALFVFAPGGTACCASFGVDSYSDAALSTERTTDGPALLDVSLSGAYTSFGLTFASYFRPGEVSVAINGDVVYSGPVKTSLQFVGFLSTEDIKTISFVSSDSVTFDTTSFNVGNAVQNAVPEMATWAMMIAGFGLVGSIMRLSRRSDERFTIGLRRLTGA